MGQNKTDSLFDRFFFSEIVLSSSGPKVVSNFGDVGWTKSQVKTTKYSLIQETKKGVDRLRQ